MLVHCFLGHSTVSALALALFFPKPSCSSMCPTKYESLLSFSKVASSSPFSVPSPSSIFYNVVLFIFIDGLSPGSMLLAPPPPSHPPRPLGFYSNALFGSRPETSELGSRPRRRKMPTSCIKLFAFLSTAATHDEHNIYRAKGRLHRICTRFLFTGIKQMRRARGGEEGGGKFFPSPCESITLGGTSWGRL